MRPRHPNKHIEEAIQYAESLGWRVESHVAGMPGGFSGARNAVGTGTASA